MSNPNKDQKKCQDSKIIDLVAKMNQMDVRGLCSMETWDYLFDVMADEKYEAEIIRYIQKRDSVNQQIRSTVSDVFRELKKLFESDPDVVDLIPMSSYSAGTNLIHGSDVDFGIIIRSMDQKNSQRIRDILDTNGYMYTKSMNGYMCYSKLVKTESGVEFEIELKVRDHHESLEVIALHHYIDHVCDERQKHIFTYLKHWSLEHKNDYPKAYSKIKLLFYNVCMLKIDPQCKTFFTNI